MWSQNFGPCNPSDIEEWDNSRQKKKKKKERKKKRISNWLTAHSVHKLNVVNSVFKVKIVASQTFCKHIGR